MVCLAFAGAAPPPAGPRVSFRSDFKPWPVFGSQLSVWVFLRFTCSFCWEVCAPKSGSHSKSPKLRGCIFSGEKKQHEFPLSHLNPKVSQIHSCCWKFSFYLQSWRNFQHGWEIRLFNDFLVRFHCLVWGSNGGYYGNNLGFTTLVWQWWCPPLLHMDNSKILPSCCFTLTCKRNTKVDYPSFRMSSVAVTSSSLRPYK